MEKAKESHSQPDLLRVGEKGKEKDKEKAKPQADPNLPNLMRMKMFHLDMVRALQ